MLRPATPADRDATRLAFGVLLAGLAARLVLAVVLDPGLDEAYAMAVSRQWQLSWFDHPPATFWAVAAARGLAAPWFAAGADVPAALLRLPFVLAFTATSWLIFDLTRRLWGARAGLWALVALTTAPFFLVSAGGWMVPDGPLLLALVATARLLIEIVFGDERRRRVSWLAAGVTLGCAGLAKYHAVLFALGAFGFLLASRHRRLLLDPAPWAAAAIALAMVAPVLIWNAGHDWASFRFQSSRGLGLSPDWRGFGRSVLGQLVWLAPWTLVGAVWASRRALRADRDGGGPAAFLVALAILPIVIFTAIPLLGGDALPHWPMPGWIFLLPLLGRAIAEVEAIERPARRLATAAAVLLGLAIVAVAVVRVAPPSRAIVERFRLERGLAEATSWVGLPQALAAQRLMEPVDGRRPLVVSLRWIEAARIGEALGPQVAVAVFDGDPRGFAFLVDPRDHLGRDAVIVTRPERLGQIATLAPYFERLDAPVPLAVGRGASPAIDLVAVAAHGMRAAYPLPYPKR